MLELGALHVASGAAFFAPVQLQYPWGDCWPPPCWDDGSGAVIARPSGADAYGALLNARLGEAAGPPRPLVDAFLELQLWIEAKTLPGTTPLLVAHAGTSECCRKVPSCSQLA